MEMSNNGNTDNGFSETDNCEIVNVALGRGWERASQIVIQRNPFNQTQNRMQRVEGGVKIGT